MSCPTDGANVEANLRGHVGLSKRASIFVIIGFSSAPSEVAPSLSISPSPTYFGGLFSRKSWEHANEGLKRPSLAVKASSKGYYTNYIPIMGWMIVENKRCGELRIGTHLMDKEESVQKAFLQAWSGYKMYALGSDELMPLSKRGIDGLGGLGDTVSMLYYDELMSLSKRGIDGLGGLGATVVDALDTTMIMKLDDVVKESGSWIEKNLPGSSSKKGQVNLFETAIRVVGGLLSAYHLSK
ncbi:mannosyl-oligosaccharide 1,2-alpha-mannosidase MNS3 [Tanacetum coccineum]